MRSLFHIVRKEFLQLLRDRKMLPIVFIAPVLQLVLLGYAANLDVTQLKTAMVDRDGSVLSRELVSRFEGSDYFDIRLNDDMPPDVDLVIVIPRDFGRTAIRGETATVQVLVNGTNSVVGTAAVNYVTTLVQIFQQEQQNRIPPVDIRSTVLFNPTMETRNFMVPGIFALLLMLITTVLSSLAIVKEKELGTLEQLNVTPVTRLEMVAGKLIPFVVIGMIDIVLVFLVSQVVFAVPFRGSLILLFGASVLFLGSTLGLGLLVSTVSETQQQAMLTASFFVMIPMFFLSGFAFPLESMPRIMQYLSLIFPLRYYLVILRGIFLKGAGVAELWEQLVMLGAFGVVIFSTAALRFRKTSG
jgi:ABC-2 type transport system permease protein